MRWSGADGWNAEGGWIKEKRYKKWKRVFYVNIFFLFCGQPIFFVIVESRFLTSFTFVKYWS